MAGPPLRLKAEIGVLGRVGWGYKGNEDEVYKGTGSQAHSTPSAPSTLSNHSNPMCPQHVGVDRQSQATHHNSAQTEQELPTLR